VFVALSRRRAAHAAVLVVIGALAGFTGPTAKPAATGAELRMTQVESPVEQLAPAQLHLDVQARTQGANQITASSFNPREALPRWVRTVRDTSLWPSADATADPIEAMPAGSAYLRPLGEYSDGRIDVYFPGSASAGWVDATAVEPSDIPLWVSTSGSRAPARIADEPAPSVTALYVAVIDDDSGQLLYGEQPHAAVPQASTTKIATTLVALERAPDLSKRVPVTVSAMAMANRDGSSTMGIEPGRSLRLETLLYGMMLPSGNDAAEQVALSLADSREQFVGWMNDEALALGLVNTRFANPSGMDAAGHYSSAYDMAMLARYAMRNPTFRTLAGTARHTSDNFAMRNLNRLLDVYPGADGVKIGYTDLAQKTIVASAVRDGHRVFVSLMHSADLVSDSIQLFDWIWDNYSWRSDSGNGPLHSLRSARPA
jgi:hypothetical protein